MTTFLINTNAEIVRDMLSGAEDITKLDVETAVSIGAGAATEVIENAGAEWDYNGSFRSWKGGRAYRMNGTPLVAIDGDKQTQDLAWKAHGAYIHSASRFVKSILDARKVIFMDVKTQN
jgi:hypothetical protein